MNETAQDYVDASNGAKSSPSLLVPLIENEHPSRTMNETLRKDDSIEDSKGIGISDSSSQKQQHLAKLDIDAAKDTSGNESGGPGSPTQLSRPATPVKPLRPTVTVPSQPATPATVASQASASSASRQAQPRTIRVVQAQKMEPPPRPSVISTAAPIATATTSKQVSRQPSLASIHQPGTPQNEITSDNASLTSASVSRPGSPPPSKVGSAPVRQTTKNQQKKERQARAKMVEERVKSEEVITDPTSEGPIQAPIVGRKKKAL